MIPLTLRLWIALHTPPANYPAARLHRIRHVKAPRFWRRLFADVLPVGMLVLMVASAWLLALLLLALLVLTLMGSGVVYGGVAAVSLSRALARQRTSGRYDLVTLTPGGAMGLHRALTAHILQQNDLLSILRGVMQRVYLGGGILLTVIFIFSAAFLNYQMSRYAENAFQVHVLPGVVGLYALLGAHGLDFARSVLVGILIGLLTPTLIPGRGVNRSETQLYAAALYAGLQVVTVIGYLLLEMGIGVLFPEPARHVIRLLLVLLVQQASVYGLWRLLLHRLNVGPAEAAAELRI